MRWFLNAPHRLAKRILSEQLVGESPPSADLARRVECEAAYAKAKTCSRWGVRCAELDRRIERADRRIESAEASQQARDEHRVKRLEVMCRWRDAGLAVRFPQRPLARVARLATLLGLAVIQSFFLASTAAVAFDIEESWSDPRYWICASCGLLTFLCGYLFAHGLRTWQLANFQRSIASDPLHTELKPFVIDPHWLSTVSIGLLFLLLNLADILVRIDVKPSHFRSALLFQLLVSFVIVAVEYSLHDPTFARPPRPTGRSAVEHWRRARLVERRTVAAVQRSTRCAELAARYATVGSILGVSMPDPTTTP